MQSTSLFLLLLAYLSAVQVYAGYSGRAKEGAPLPMAFARPVNVDQGIDCAVKELAWEYAKKLQPQVNQSRMTYHYKSIFIPLPLSFILLVWKQYSSV